MTAELSLRSSSSCWFPDTYCRPSPSNLLATGNATTASKCQALNCLTSCVLWSCYVSIYVNCQGECNNTEGCVFFTFLRHRGEPQCSLLSSCTRCLADTSFIKETKDDSKRNGMRGRNDFNKLLVVGALIYPKTHVCPIEKH